MGTKNNPGAFDCYDVAEPDEPMFVLLARDPDAAHLVEEWAIRRAARVLSDRPSALVGAERRKIEEARDCAHAMRVWHTEHRS